jgi:hypothetical protein
MDAVAFLRDMRQPEKLQAPEPERHSLSERVYDAAKKSGQEIAVEMAFQATIEVVEPETDTLVDVAIEVAGSVLSS